MKLFLNLGITVVVALTMVVTSCGGGPIEHGTEYIIECPSDADTTDIGNAYLILENRLKEFGLEGNYEMSRDGNRFTLKVSHEAIQDSIRIRRLLQSSANLTFRSTYTISEIASVIDTVQKTFLRVNHVDSLNSATSGLNAYIVGVSNSYDSPLIAFFRPADTAAVMEILNHDSVTSLLPADLVFHWGKGDYLEDGSRSVALFACKEGYNFVMSGDYVESATTMQTQGTEQFEVSLVFNSTGADAFARITKANTGHALAMELDNFIYSYPMVLQEITGGKAQITGNFTETEADDLVKLLSAGSLPTTFRIVEESKF